METPIPTGVSEENLSRLLGHKDQENAYTTELKQRKLNCKQQKTNCKQMREQYINTFLNFKEFWYFGQSFILYYY